MPEKDFGIMVNAEMMVMIVIVGTKFNSCVDVTEKHIRIYVN